MNCPKCDNKGYTVAYDGVSHIQCETCNGASVRWGTNWGSPPSRRVPEGHRSCPCCAALVRTRRQQEYWHECTCGCTWDERKRKTQPEQPR
jgi:hypothetical protein